MGQFFFRWAVLVSVLYIRPSVYSKKIVIKFSNGLENHRDYVRHTFCCSHDFLYFGETSFSYILNQNRNYLKGQCHENFI